MRCNDRVVRCFHRELQGGRQRRVDTSDEAETNNGGQDKLGSWRKHFDFLFGMGRKDACNLIARAFVLLMISVSWAEVHLLGCNECHVG